LEEIKKEMLLSEIVSGNVNDLNIGPRLLISARTTGTMVKPVDGPQN